MTVTPPADASPADLVERSLRDLGWGGPARVVTELTGGASGSQVFLLDLGGEPAVLKTTEDPAWYARAARELAVHRELGPALRDFLPEARATHRDPHGVRLLLAAHDPFPRAAAVTEAAWIELADRLGRLQQVAVPRPGWLRPRPRPSPAAVADAVRGWARHGSAALAARAAERLDAARSLPSGLATVLTHGDCHVGNVLNGPGGRPVWVDWQEVCLSSGLDDLVFLWQRAEFDGAHPPRAAMTAAYAAARGVPRGGALRAALDSCELRRLLVDWPPFLGHGSPDHRQVMTRRLEELADGAVGS